MKKAFLLLFLLTATAWARMYQTSFPQMENPLSESSNWIGGKQVGQQWKNCASLPGLAYGTQSGGSGYDDSTCVLTGDWGPDQTAQATIHVGMDSVRWTTTKEVELRLRTTITAGNISGYEVNCSVSPRAGNYLQIVRWNGPLGSFAYVGQSGTQCKDGDILKATIQGSTITVYLNGNQVMSRNDSTFSSGAPGIGFYMVSGNSGTNQSFGFSNFSADDGTVTQPPPPIPTGTLSASPGTIQAGQSSTLTWSTVNATSATIGNGIGTVSLSGSRTVSPTVTTTYTITATSAAGSDTASATVTVTQPPPPATGPSFRGVPLVACTLNLEGTPAPVDNSTTQTWGAVIVGGGSLHVGAYCNGTSWTVGGT
jgi:hypothetical protein